MSREGARLLMAVVALGVVRKRNALSEPSTPALLKHAFASADAAPASLRYRAVNTESRENHPRVAVFVLL